jgi:hypothetical protein
MIVLSHVEGYKIYEVQGLFLLYWTEGWTFSNIIYGYS